jgi:hypothetical protein
VLYGAFNKGENNVQRQSVRFQMKTSNRPQTIAVVTREVDIKSFREDPGWYELIDVTEEHQDNTEQPSIVVKQPRKQRKLKEL